MAKRSRSSSTSGRRPRSQEAEGPPSPPRRDEEWRRSISSQERLENLVVEGVLPDATTGGWRPAAGEDLPTPQTTEVVTFESFLLRGLGFPLHPFLRGLLCYYGIELYHLNPNSIVQIAIFINLCESYIGIEPHFDLFRYFFYIKAHPFERRPNVVGGARLQFREGREAEYLFVPGPDTNKEWHNEWFYMVKHEPSISNDIDHHPSKRLAWIEEPQERNMPEMRELIQLIAKLKTEGLTGVGMAANFMLRRIKPLKARSLTAYKYAGEDNFNHEAPERLNKADACNRLSKFFAHGTSLRTTGGPLPFSLGNPRPEGRLAFFSRPSLPEQPRQVGLAPVDPIAALHQARTAGAAEENVGGGS
ncbi:unnamed protein product [Urochloa humidicola]